MMRALLAHPFETQTALPAETPAVICKRRFGVEPEGNMADNKRQHYVPKSTLRYFALDFGSSSKPKQIRLVNIDSLKVVPRASLKEQCYQDYFYGKDLSIEKAFGELEGYFANVIRNMMGSRSIDERDGWHLVQMVALQKARTLRAEEEYNSMLDRMMKMLMYNRIEEEALRSVKIGMKDAANQNVAFALAMRRFC
jgi:hypothetical protein